MGSWDDATAKAQKILGDDAKLPKLSAKVTSAQDKLNESSKVFVTARDACSEKLGDLDDNITSFENALQHFRAEIEGNNFELDPKKDAKKIKQAKAILFGLLDSEIKSRRNDDKSLDELDRHLVLLRKYKPSPSAFQ